MTTADENRRDDDALAAEYALGVLPHEERIAFARRLTAETELADRVRFWDERFADLSEQVEPVEPPAGILRAVEEELFEAATQAGGWWHSLGFWRGLSFVSLAGLALIGVLYLGLLLAPDTAAPSPAYVAELASENGTVRMVALYDPRDGSLRINRTAGAPAAGRDFELWLIEGGNSPVSLGVLPGAATGTLALDEALKPRLAGAVLAISDEPRGGSPTGAPSGAVLATGEISEI